MIPLRLIFDVRTALVKDQLPTGVRVFHRRLIVPAVDQFERQNMGQHGDRFVEITTFAVTVDEAGGLNDRANG